MICQQQRASDAAEHTSPYLTQIAPPAIIMATFHCVIHYLLDSSAADVGRQNQHEGHVDIFVFKQFSCCSMEQEIRRHDESH